MMEWWETATFIQQTLTVIGVASTVLLVVQIILTLIGAVGEAAGGGSADVDFDTGGDVAAGDFDTGGGFDADFEVGSMDGGLDFDLPDLPEFDLPDLEVSDGGGYEGSGRVASGGGEMPEGAHGAGLRLFTMQGFIAFFSIFAWTSLLLIDGGLMTGLSLIMGIVFGFAAMVVMAFLMKSMLKLQYDGTMNIRNAVGKSGEVYLPVYEHRTGVGKVSLIVQGRLVELSAVTDQDEKIPTGAQVTVVGITNSNTLIVKEKK